MFGGSSSCGQDARGPQDMHDARPSKRPRNVGESSFRDSVQAGPIEDHGMGSPTDPMGRAGRSDGGHNSIVSATMPANASTAGRGRVDDKNNRKLSCKECRRLKLKCDRVFPCQSCVKRGCGSLCPEGALTSGRGSRFILAGAEQLHEKIHELGDRVRQLEDALEALQATCSSHPHPLLAPELLKIKTSQELYGTAQNAQPPTPQQQQQPPLPQPLPLQPSSAAPAGKDENLRLSVGSIPIRYQSPAPRPNSRGTELGRHGRGSATPEVPPDILQLSATFPFPWCVDLSIRKRIRDSLPPKDQAQRICEEAMRNALWQYNLDASETFLPNLLHYCYSTAIEDLSPRRLALLLMVLSIGSLVDLNQPLGSLHGEAYHHLARAAVCEIPLMEEPDFDVLHALFFMIWYHLIFSDNKKAVGYAWNLMGFVAKLAQGLGLHRDAPRLKGIPEEHEKRRAVFWELLNMDCRMSLSLGRPPSICLAHVDAKTPTYVGPGIYVPRQEIVYHEWKSGFFIKCLSPILEAMVAVKAPPYSRILELDGSVRDFDVPTMLDDNIMQDLTPRFLVMQGGLVAIGRELALLQLHRKYFTDAMSGPDGFDLDHDYGPSVLATYLSASNLITAVETLYKREQQLTSRFLHFWFNTFSATVTLSLLISRAPSIPLASYALKDMERACQLFRKAATILPFSGKALPVMQKLADKSRRTLLQPLGNQSLTKKNSNMRYSQPQARIPPSFTNAHPGLSEYAEKLIECAKTSASLYPSAPQQDSWEQQPALNITPGESWMPDIYDYSSLGFGLDDRYAIATSQPTPFTPSSPRIAENKDYNFDHGALTPSLVDETSYMAWF